MANWYVRTSAAGSANGSDWNNAWSLTNLNSNWSSVSAGDTVWMAGGTYTVGIRPTKSGSAGNVISIKRPLSTDGVPTSSPGWSSGFDSQVKIHPPATSECQPVAWSSSAGSYLTIDGRVDSGIELLLLDTDPDAVGVTYPGCLRFVAGVHNVTVRYVEMIGQTAGGGQPAQNTCSAVSAVDYDATIDSITISHFIAHGFINAVTCIGFTNTIFEYGEWYDNDAGAGSDLHANFFEYQSSGNIIFRYNNVHTWAVEGFMLYAHAWDYGPLYIYGNWFHDPIVNQQFSNCCARILEAFPDSSNHGQGPVYFYNNTVSDVIYTMINTSDSPLYGGDGIGRWATGCVAKNNIFWNCYKENWDARWTHDYNYANNGAFKDSSAWSAMLAEAHFTNGTGSTPFANYGGDDFHIVSTIGAAYPRDKGVALGSPYDIDPDGNARGADGTWDIGAYEYPGEAPAATSQFGRFIMP